ncbi:MAG: protein kinase [Phycisphaera sp.]|nr:protein kinase [Phycisphaera sp.]
MQREDGATFIGARSGATDGRLSGIPSRIARFTVERAIGSGSFGDVHLAVEDGPLARRVALKVVRPNARGAALDAALREARMLARLDHPSIARVIDAGATGDGRAFIALEYIDGRTFSAWCSDSEPSVASRLEVLEDVAAAIAYAHDRGTIHRDLKPANIMVREGGGARASGVVLDFGVAALVDDSDDRDAASTLEATISARRAGTLETMAPEQFILGASPSVRADLYSLGVLLHWSVAGRPPFARTSPSDILGFAQRVQGEALRAIRSQDLAAGVELPSAQLRDLNAVLSRALAKDPQQRYASATEFAQELARLRRREPTDATAPGLLARSRRFVARNKVPVMSASVVIGTLFASTAVVSGFAASEREARISATTELERATLLAEALRGNLRALTGDLVALGNMPQLVGYWPNILAAYETVEGRDSIVLAQQRTFYAEQLTRSGRAPEAIEQLQEALRAANLHDHAEIAAAICLRLAFALEETGRVDEALAVMDGAIANDLPKLDPLVVTNHPWFFHGLRGRLLATLGRRDEGIAAIREAIILQDRAIGGKGSLNDSQLRGVLVSELIRADRIDEALVEGDALVADIERNKTAERSAGIRAWRERTRSDLLRLRLERASDADAPELAAELRSVAIEWRRLTGPSADKFTAINHTLGKRGYPPITEEEVLAFIENLKTEQGMAAP